MGTIKPRATRSKLEVMHPDAAGIDVGGSVHYVAVRNDAAEQSVRHFGVYTRDLHELADWLQACGVKIVAMESTGVYWIALYELLERRGFEVLLVDAIATIFTPHACSQSANSCRSRVYWIGERLAAPPCLTAIGA